MVVIRESENELLSILGETYKNKLFDYANIIGYSIEEDGNEIRIEFNPDRPDLFSFFALKENMKIYYDNNFRIKGILGQSDIKLIPDNNVLKVRPYVLAFVASGGKIGKNVSHIIEYQERLHETIGKSRKKVAIGIHDLNKIKPNFKYTIIDSNKIKFTTYDGFTGTADEIIKNHEKGTEFSGLLPDKSKVPLILDSENDVMSMPPIINGIKSKITEDTERFFFDITGTDYNAVRNAFFLLAYEMSYLGYRIYSCDSGMGTKKMQELHNFDFREIKIKSKDIKNVMGFIPEDPIILLRKMGYRCEISADGYKINVPGNRIDVMGPADIVEDIAKSYGYDNIKETKLKTCGIGNPYAENENLDLIREIMTSINYQEIKTFVINSKSFYESFGYHGGVYVQNPKSLDFSVVRDRLLPGMMDFLVINKRRKLPFKIFEIGEVIDNIFQHTHLCTVYVNTTASYSDIFQVINYLNKRVNNYKLTVKQYSTGEIIPGRGGQVFINNEYVGLIGELNPDIITRFGLSVPVSFFEIDIGKMLSL
ncbi:phenylalanine--tRNA ligase subunit beta [Acidiplasma sp.]|uniref:phenylalanine--tRNA ligase subunit beta n=1 Tax=Acidiplasma sp. TaxID=1872114 RepID=UPI0031620D62